MADMNSLFSDIERGRQPICVVGLGYVGLPLLCRLARKFKVIGFDINAQRVAELRTGVDRTKEVERKEDILNANITYTTDASAIKNSPFVIVAVPTPVDSFKVPDLSPVRGATKTVGQNLKPGAVIVFESTVYPGVTEDVCGAILAKESGLACGEDFFLGYSPERINPGDRVHTVEKIVKVVSGQTPAVAVLLVKVYGAIIVAGTHKAANIKSAEAAKVIENTQRDLNIALINELAMLFDRIGLDTTEVLEAAGTKWNFLPFRPGLVGGHCIGVDPYYLTYLADGLGFHTQMITSGRRTNDQMADFVAKKALVLMMQHGHAAGRKPRVALLGATFKENVPDIRNTKVVEVAENLERMGCDVFIHDPLADAEEFKHEYNRELVQWHDIPASDAIIFAVKHEYYMKEMTLAKLKEKMAPSLLLLDLKAAFSREEAAKLKINLWRL
jgi:UDP-N-acetyl-D-galactosamine dehydrogenase